jgi:hypothetical protein
MIDLSKEVIDHLDIFIRPMVGLMRKPAPYYILTLVETSEPAVREYEYSFTSRIKNLEYKTNLTSELSSGYELTRLSTIMKVLRKLFFKARPL